MGRFKIFFIMSIVIVIIIGLSNKISYESIVKEDYYENIFDGTKEDYYEKGKIKTGNPLYIRIFKEEKQLELWLESDKNKYELYKTYGVCSFSGGLGPKKIEGDKKSPEGFYYTHKSLLNPNSTYHLSFNIGYPNEYDKSHGYTGSLIMVHGSCLSIGCYAMTDEYIEEIYDTVEKSLKMGQKKIDVHVFPFKMTEENMKRYKKSEYYNFWKELKPGYDYFEKNKIPPKVKVKNKRYIISN